MPAFKRIDIHAHLNFSAFDADRDETAKRAFDDGTAVINVGTQIDTSRAAVELAEKYEHGMFAIIGLHPIHTSASFHDEKELGGAGDSKNPGFVSRGEEFDADAYRELLKHPKVVGIGECGLDYYRLSDKSKENQKKAFLGQIALAEEFDKPLMLHIREAYADALEILKAHPNVRGNVHFFAGSTADAAQFLDCGFTLSFTGVITFARQYKELVGFVPLDMMHAETDCPYIAPVPYRGKRNEPLYVCEVTAAIARIKNLPLEKVESQLLENGRRVFKVGI